MKSSQEAIDHLSQWVKENTKKGEHPPQYGLDKALILCRNGQRAGLENLVIFTYHQTASFRKATEWNWLEKVSRGLIFEKETGKLIARPFYKFYNYGELPTDKDLVSNDINEVNYKHDGSLGICFYYNEQWWVTTYGSLNSEQGEYATVLLRNYDTSKLNPLVTTMTEIIYPENRIVSNYQDFKGLIYLDQQPLYENSNEVSDYSIFPSYHDKLTTYYDYLGNRKHSIKEMLNFCKENQDFNYEGFVLKQGNSRYKFKTDAYLAVHRAKFNISVNNIKEMMMQSPDVLLQFKESLPNEFFGEIDNIIAKLNDYVMGYMKTTNEYVSLLLEKYQIDANNVPKDIGRVVYPDVNQLDSFSQKFVWMKIKGVDYQDIYNYILKTYKGEIDD